MAHRKTYHTFGPVTGQKPTRRFGRLHMVVLVAIVIVTVGGVWVLQEPGAKAKIPAVKPTASHKLTMAQPIDSKNAPAPQPAVTKIDTGHCTDNTLDKQIYVSISARHLWACEADKQVYDSAVVTGMENLAADLTPTGTYHILSKQTNLYLDGSDSTGSWHDPVSYWMPFLNNQYGTYGFHDATWRADSDFGNISPYSTNASHGCVELPLATAKWIYGWAPVGTQLTIQS